MNTISLVGNVARIELGETKNGKTVADISLAVNDGFGENKTTYFFSVQAFDSTAEACGKYIDKGSQIAVVGKLVQNRYTNKDGVKITLHKILANSIDFVGAPAKAKDSKEKLTEVSEEDYPF